MKTRNLYQWLVCAVVSLVVICVAASAGAASEAREYYLLGAKAAQHGDVNSAFMHFRALVNTSADSPYREDAAFAVAEYYYLKGIMGEATRAFSGFLKEYPDSSQKIFALAYLLKIAERAHSAALVEKLRHQIVTYRQVSLLFRDAQEYAYTSGLDRHLKIIYYIDTVEIYANEERIADIPY